jgi:large subunit ribosomal protein L15
MKLNQLAGLPGSRQSRMRVGRGIGSGKGKTAGRGVKGQKARTRVSINGFEGGQMPLHRRLPKRGFNNIFTTRLNEVNLGRVQEALDAGALKAAEPITAELLVKAGVLRRKKEGVRLLGGGELKTKASFVVHGASKSAIAAVEKLGGTVEVLYVRPEPPKLEEKPWQKKQQELQAKPEKQEKKPAQKKTSDEKKSEDKKAEDKKHAAKKPTGEADA